MSLGVVAQRDNDRAAALAGRMRAEIGPGNVHVDVETARVLEAPGVPVDRLAACDLVVSIGGDGTFLFAARRIGETPLIGVNLGEVGFLTAIHPDEAIDTVREAFTAAEAGTLDIRTIPRLIGRVDEWSTAPALNELMVHGPRRGPGNRITVEVRIDDARYDRSRVDGVMVATPAGSTAYNLSERGPMIAPGVDGMVVNQMCPDAGRPPVVVPADAEIEIEVITGTNAHVVGDGRSQRRVDAPLVIRIERAHDPLHVAGPPIDFFEAIDRLA